MKKIFFFSLAVFLFNSLNTLAQSPKTANYSLAVNDSLLFDGANNSSPDLLNKAFEDCFVRVVYVKGSATGTRIYSYTEKLCGVTDTVTKMEKGKVKPNDKLRTGDMISTGPGSYMEIKFNDGKSIRLSPNTSLTINENYCKDNSHIQVNLKEGEMYADDRPGSKDKSINVSTRYGTAIVDGTMFSIGTIPNGNDTTDILKVYEGSVKFRMDFRSGANKKVEIKGVEIKKAYDDYKSGKISADEYAKKLQDLQQEVTESLPKEAITVNAGYQSKIINSGNPTEPELIDTNESRWWDDSNFH